MKKALWTSLPSYAALKSGLTKPSKKKTYAQALQQWKKRKPLSRKPVRRVSKKKAKSDREYNREVRVDSASNLRIIA